MAPTGCQGGHSRQGGEGPAIITADAGSIAEKGRADEGQWSRSPCTVRNYFTSMIACEGTPLGQPIASSGLPLPEGIDERLYAVAPYTNIPPKVAAIHLLAAVWRDRIGPGSSPLSNSY